MAENRTNLSKTGKVDIDREILLSIINLATKEINGVSALTNIQMPILNKISNKQEGVRINFNSNGLLDVDVYIVIKIGYSVPDIAYKIQENIKNSLNTMVAIKAGKVNVHVCDVDCDDGDIK